MDIYDAALMIGYNDYQIGEPMSNVNAFTDPLLRSRYYQGYIGATYLKMEVTRKRLTQALLDLWIGGK